MPSSGVLGKRERSGNTPRPPMPKSTSLLQLSSSPNDGRCAGPGLAAARRWATDSAGMWATAARSRALPSSFRITSLPGRVTGAVPIRSRTSLRAAPRSVKTLRPDRPRSGPRRPPPPPPPPPGRPPPPGGGAPPPPPPPPRRPPPAPRRERARPRRVAPLPVVARPAPRAGAPTNPPPLGETPRALHPPAGAKPFPLPPPLAAPRPHEDPLFGELINSPRHDALERADRVLE